MKAKEINTLPSGGTGEPDSAYHYFGNEIFPALASHQSVATYQNDSTSATIQKNSPPTPEQIRYWRMRELNKVFIKDTKYLISKELTSFESTGMPPRNLELPSRPLNQYSDDWFTALFLGSVVVFSTVKHSFDKYLYNLFQSLFSYNTSARMFRERNISVIKAAFKLDIISYIILGLFLFQVLQYFSINNSISTILLFLISQAGIILFLLAKKMFYFITGWITEKQYDTSEFLYNYNNYIRVMGLVMLPVVAIIAWTPAIPQNIAIRAGLTIVSILYLLLLWRGAIIFLKKHFSIFYLFLYLCTLEILPLLMVLKIISD